MTTPTQEEVSQHSVSIKGRKDTTDRILSKLKRVRPQKDDRGTFEVSRSNKDILSKVKYVLKTGLQSFDDATGGIPCGRITELYGLDSSGKTGLVIRACCKAKAGNIYERLDDKSLVKLDNAEVTVLYIDNEQSLDDNERVVVDGVELDCIIERCDTVDLLFKTIDVAIDALSEVEQESKVRQFMVIVVDTIAATASTEEITAAWGAQDYPRQAKQIREGFRILVRKIHKQNVFLICTNQVGDNFRARAQVNRSMLPQDSDFATPGGRALKFYASLRVFLCVVNNSYKLTKGVKFSDGLLIQFFVSKNRQVKPLRSGRLVLLFDGGYSDPHCILETLVYLKFVTVGAAGNIMIDFSRYGIKAPGPSLEDQEEGKDSTECASREDWIEFFKRYNEAIMQLWSKAVEYMFKNEAIAAAEVDDEDDILTED